MSLTDRKTTIEVLRSLIRLYEAHIAHCEHYYGKRSDEDQIRVDGMKTESRADIAALTEAVVLLESASKDAELIQRSEESLGWALKIIERDAGEWMGSNGYQIANATQVGLQRKLGKLPAINLPQGA